MTFSHSRYNPQIKLSPKEMLEISQEINQAFAPDFSIKKPEPATQYKLAPKDLLGISEEIRRDFAPGASTDTRELVLLPVDPDHLYAYWNLGDVQLNTTPEADFKNQLTLRVYSAPNKTKSWFDVAIDSAQAQQSVFLPMRADETAYCATICKRYPDNSLAPLVYSNTTQVPPGKTMPEPSKEKPIVFKQIPQPVIANPEISHYTNGNASGQG